MKTSFTTHVTLARKTAIFSTLLGLSGIVVAAIIMLEKIALLTDPNHVTSCSFNPIVSCSPVMQSEQAAAFFGIPNPLFGLIGFSVVTALSFFSIFVTLPRFVWVINTVGMLSALIFCFWLASQALFVIGALCLYCCGIWVITSILFWLSVHRVTRETKFEVVGDFAGIGATATVIVFAVLVFFAFQTFWLSLLT